MSERCESAVRARFLALGEPEEGELLVDIGPSLARVKVVEPQEEGAVVAS